MVARYVVALYVVAQYVATSSTHAGAAWSATRAASIGSTYRRTTRYGHRPKATVLGTDHCEAAFQGFVQAVAATAALATIHEPVKSTTASYLLAA
jgi:hypothetical protein